MTDTTSDQQKSIYLWWKFVAQRVGLICGGFLVGVVLAEIILAVQGKPRFHQAHSSPPQFEFLQSNMGRYPVYVNTPSVRIQFRYDSNPRGYFGVHNEINHSTNSRGFRGGEFVRTKSPNTVRLLFLGDSFTFGEGVRDEDVYPQVTASSLQQRLGGGAPNIQCYNLGVGGYNTSQSAHLLESVANELVPDIVILGYVLNDAEPPLFQVSPSHGGVERAVRPAEIWEGRGDPEPPGSIIFDLRVAQLAWQTADARKRTQQTMDHYRSLYDESHPGWQASRRALRVISDYCQERELPCFVVLFPILHNLNDDYPFADIHARIVAEVGSLDATCIDVFPTLKGMDARVLWVHPTDQHPNEVVHAMVGRLLAERLIGDTAAAKKLKQTGSQSDQ